MAEGEPSQGKNELQGAVTQAHISDFMKKRTYFLLRLFKNLGDRELCSVEMWMLKGNILPDRRGRWAENTMLRAFEKLMLAFRTGFGKFGKIRS